MQAICEEADGGAARRSAAFVTVGLAPEEYVGVSIYYTASRQQPLTSDECAAVDAIIARYPVEALIAKLGIGEDEYRGEGFCVYDEDTEPGVVFEGATKLPFTDDDDVVWAALEHWCALLSEVRRVIEGATWEVHVDEAHVPWDEELQSYGWAR
jgi:hypothetical protein